MTMVAFYVGKREHVFVTAAAMVFLKMRAIIAAKCFLSEKIKIDKSKRRDGLHNKDCFDLEIHTFLWHMYHITFPRHKTDRIVIERAIYTSLVLKILLKSPR